MKWTRGSLNLSMGILLVVVGGVTAPQAHSAVIDYKPLVIEVKSNDRLVVQGFEGTIKVEGKASGSRELSIRVKQENPAKMSAEAKSVLDEWNFSLQRKGDIIEAAIHSPQSKSSWAKLLMGGVPQFYLEITAPSVPLEISWRKGQVAIENWSAPVSAHLLKGNLRLHGGKGEATLRNSSGELSVVGREGNIVVDCFNSKVQLTNIKGKIDLENFTGETRVAELEGGLHLVTTAGQVKIDGLKGRLDFQNIRANLMIDKLSGELRGQSGGGSVTANVFGDADVRIQSKEGNINLTLPNSGASVNVATAEGQLVLPAFLAVTRSPNLKSSKGKLRGEVAGSVFVRTTEGNIRIK